MSREIKFRGWDKTNNTMVSLAIGITNDGRFNIIPGNNISGMTLTDLMQYTGLKDKNGKEIYEGDIVKEKDGVAPVEYLYTEFLAMDITDNGNCNLLGEHCEVIGNIYENPELNNAR